MATRSPERRFRSDRRRPAHQATDLHQRLENKRRELERRRAIRRSEDRTAGDGDDARSVEQADSGPKAIEPNDAGRGPEAPKAD